MRRHMIYIYINMKLQSVTVVIIITIHIITTIIASIRTIINMIIA